ncbi:MAG: MBL fold metallo-hydrolase [Planctomycetia bacterium]|jgi:metallo-beta-lactamase family protein
MNIQFLGAAKQVTGSQYCISHEGKTLMIDCGMYQERPYLERNWSPFVIPPKEIDAVLITHAHLDHCGLLPKLVHDGFNGPIFTTAASDQLIEIVLRDSAKIQAEDVKFKLKRHRKEGRTGPHPIEPLYTSEDVDKTIPMIEDVRYSRPFVPAPGLVATFHDAGHILGSAMIDIRLESKTHPKRVIFSGDVGQGNTPIVRDPSIFKEADYIVMESTYGDRDHQPEDNPEDTAAQLARYISETVKRDGSVIIPTFAIERAQELIYQIGRLITKGLIPEIPVFLDSPMAGKVTRVFRKHRNLFDEDAWKRINEGDSPLTFPGLKITESPQESKDLNHLDTPAIIMSTSGMCTAGRIKHHLKHHISRPEDLILFVGYQASGTLGRHILNGAKEVRIHGRHHPVRAQVAQVHGFSGHADRGQLMDWLSHFQTAPKRIFLTHGDGESAESLANDIRQKHGWNVHIPVYKEIVKLEE